MRLLLKQHGAAAPFAGNRFPLQQQQFSSLCARRTAQNAHPFFLCALYPSTYVG
jgi:hypothetical protein